VAPAAQLREESAQRHQAALITLHGTQGQVGTKHGHACAAQQYQAQLQRPCDSLAQMTEPRPMPMENSASMTV
jgi:hypothetical protein